MSPRIRPDRRSIRSAAAAAIVLLISVVASLAAATPAWAAATVTVAGPDGAVVSADYATEVTVSGTGFQSIQNGFGGVYVLFGWVDDASGGSWRPSQGGVVGEDYRYVPDAEAAENNGFQRFLAFAGSSTESSANGVLAADGSWSIGMVVPGASFESQDRDGNTVSVDCRQVTCGIITIGAHGVKNANNETFTPLSFAAAPAAGAATGGGDAAPDAAPAPSTPVGEVRVGVESEAVRAGNAIVFTGRGFTPGEQIMASLDGGLAAVGPLTAGTQGEVAAALPVPADAQNGTHLLTLRGAASGAVAELPITVTDGAGIEPAAAATPETPAWVVAVLLASIVLALVLIVTSVVAAFLRARRRRRARRRAASASSSASASSPPPVVAAESVGVSR
ncbi:hypothetical protein ACFXP7_03955 [Microbacterium sp. P06]|uniref:hypothetical protein n=1 Tax=Microbacterium sp. P06 TaxID=3366949 RepID=UPI003747371B